jgi:hypothetical protein
MTKSQDETQPVRSSPRAECCSGSAASEGVYRIRVAGHLDHTWAEWLGAAAAQPVECGETILTVPVADQAALMGVLDKLNRLNLKLLAINPGLSGGEGGEGETEQRERLR